MRGAFQNFRGTHIVKRRDFSLFALTEAVYPARLRMLRHEHEPASFSVVLSGGYREQYGKKIRQCQSSAVVFHPAEEMHAVDFGSVPVRILNLEIKPNWREQLWEYSQILDQPAICSDGVANFLARRLHAEFCRMDDFSPLVVEGLGLELLGEVGRSVTEKNGYPPWLRRVEDFLRSHFAEAPTVTEIAAMAQVHPVHLARVFRTKHGCTVGEYLRRLRLDFACQQVASTKLALGEIALAAGFADQSHFTRSFTAHFGLTPSAYRRNLSPMTT